jgi:hypothetical protein
LGSIWADVNALGVGIHCSSSVHDATDIYWDVVLFPNIH